VEFCGFQPWLNCQAGNVGLSVAYDSLTPLKAALMSLREGNDRVQLRQPASDPVQVAVSVEAGKTVNPAEVVCVRIAVEGLHA